MNARGPIERHMLATIRTRAERPFFALSMAHGHAILDRRNLLAEVDRLTRLQPDCNPNGNEAGQ